MMAATMTMTARFSARDLVIAKDGAEDVVNLAGYPALVVPGAPRVPRVVQSVVIPAGAVPTGVELVAEEWTDLEGSFDIGPAQADARFPRAGETYVPPVVPRDAAIYGSAAAWPTWTFRLAGYGTMAGYRIAHVELLPVRYHPSTGRLQLATRLSYRLSYEQQVEATVATAQQRDEFGAAVRALAANPRDVDRFAPRVSSYRSSTTLPPGHYEYVVVTESPMDTVFQRLVDWKAGRGRPGNVVRVSWINTNYTGYDLQEKIRNFIMDAYATWGTMYVLLGGQGDYQSTGQNIVPTRMANYGGNGDEPCDLYYAGLDGTWDRSGNHVYGELNDSADMYSDVYVGRAPVYNVAMAQNFVSKVIRYEQNPPTGFLKKMLLPTAILWSSYEERPMVESIARMTPAGWVDGRLYERTGTLSAQSVRDSINAGIGMSHWDGHGSESGIYMGSTPFFSSSDAQALTNGDKTGMAMSIACDCAAWDWVPNGDCLAEHMVNRVGGGFIASMMNTRYGYGAIGPGGGYVPGPSERLDTTYFSGVFDRGLYHTGEALGYSKACWAPYADSLYQYDMQRYCIYDLVLIGDPETPLWTDQPTAVVATHTGVVNVGNNIPYFVNVATVTAAPVCSALVTLQKGSEFTVSGRTDNGGNVTLYVSALTPGEIDMTVDARNHFVLFDTVMAIASSRYVSYLRSTISDPGPGGNDDGILNPGEAVEVPLWVKNWGQQGATGVSGRLVTHDPNAHVGDSVKTFGSVGAGDSAWTGANGFNLSVDNGLANGYTVACSLICRDALDSVWVSFVNFRVGAPLVGYAAMSVRDSLGANPNDKLDPGETADLVVQVRNSGQGNAYNLRAVLRSTDARLTVPDSTADLGLVPHDSAAWNHGDHFVIHADGSIPMETPVVCSLDLYADAGYVGHAAFTLVVGEIRTVDPIPDGPRQPALYWAYDEVDAGYSQCPDYGWVELRGTGTPITFSDDQTVVVTIPAWFGPVRFYDQNYTQLSICSNGFVAFGSTTNSAYSNTSIPSSSMPAMVAFNWDDLYPPSGRGVYYLADSANHRFIVEFDSIPYYSSRSTADFIQVVITDTSVTHGNSNVTVMYKTAAYTSSSTHGIQNSNGSVGIQCLFDGTYTRGASPWVPMHAVKYTTGSPVTAVAEPTAGAGVLRRLVNVYPNPFAGAASINWQLVADGRVDLAVYDASGRLVRTLASGSHRAGEHTAVWNGADDAGRPVARGVYFVRLATRDRTVNVKTILTR
jgi:hypothetical protein